MKPDEEEYFELEQFEPLEIKIVPFPVIEGKLDFLKTFDHLIHRSSTNEQNNS